MCIYSRCMMVCSHTGRPGNFNVQVLTVVLFASGAGLDSGLSISTLEDREQPEKMDIVCIHYGNPGANSK